MNNIAQYNAICFLSFSLFALRYVQMDEAKKASENQRATETIYKNNYV